MPISFQPMSPYSDLVSQATGAMDQQEKNRQFEMQNFNTLSDAQAKQHAQQVAEAKLVQDQEQFGASLQERQRSQESQQAAQQDAIRLQSDLHAKVQEMQFNREATYADKMRLQTLDQGRATVQSLMDSNSIKPEDYFAAMNAYHAGADPLRAMIQGTEMRRRDQQNQLLAHQLAAQTTMQKANEDFLAEGGPRIVERPDGSQYFQHRPGEWTQARPPRPTAPERPALTPQIRLQISRSVDQAMNQEARALPAPAWAASNAARQAERLRRIHEEENRHMGTPGGASADPQAQQASFDNLIGALLQSPPAATPAQPPSQPDTQAAQMPPTPVTQPGAEGW